MANLCEVDMRLRAKKDNAFGLLNVLNALINPKDYIETHSIMCTGQAAQDTFI